MTSYLYAPGILLSTQNEIISAASKIPSLTEFKIDRDSKKANN